MTGLEGLDQVARRGSREHLHHAADELEGLLRHTTGAPWRMSDPGTDGSRYRALVGATATAEKLNAMQRWQNKHHSTGHAYGPEHELEAYGGWLVAESCSTVDRQLMAVMRNVAEHLPALLRAVADEDPLEVGRIARHLTAELCPCDDHDQHRARRDAEAVQLP